MKIVECVRLEFPKLRMIKFKVNQETEGQIVI